MEFPLPFAQFEQTNSTQEVPQTVTENLGNYNQTNNASNVYRDCGNAIFYLQIGPNDSPSTSVMPVFPSASYHPFLLAQGPQPVASIPAALSSSRANPSIRRGDDQTPGQRYTYHLSACKLGYPLWKPSPRCTATGKEYTINIGDVGVCSDLDPFHTLFNITHGKQVPENVDPLRNIEGDITVDAGYHQEYEVLTRPKGAISRQWEDSSVFTFQLSAKEGALLLLPRGGILKKLQSTHEFKIRIQNYWREWYEFAERAGDLDESQTLCLLTGIERCSTWAMAVWDSNSDYSRAQTDTLELTVDRVSGRCAWGFRPARCWTQSALTPTTHLREPKETVFVRGIWISRTNGSGSTSPSPPAPPSGEQDENNDDDPSGGGRHFRQHPSDQARPTTRSSHNPFRNRWTNQTSSSRTPPSDCNSDTGTTAIRDIADQHPNAWNTVYLPETVLEQWNSLDQPPSEWNTVRVPEAAFETTVSHPCQVINKLALELISQSIPSLLDAGCVVFSSDEDWMSVLEDGDDGFSSGTELLRRVCQRVKFVAKGGSIYTEIMTKSESERVQRSASLVGHKERVIPFLFHIFKTDVARTQDGPGSAVGFSARTKETADVLYHLSSGTPPIVSYDQSRSEERQHPKEPATGFSPVGSSFVLYQTGMDPYNSNFEDAEGRVAFTMALASHSPNLVVRLTREVPWASQCPDIMGPERSYFHFGPQVTPGYIVYENNRDALPMGDLCRVEKEESNSRHFTALSGRVYKWKISPQRMECIDGGLCLASWERLPPSPESNYQARVILHPVAFSFITEIMTTLILNQLYMWSNW